MDDLPSHADREFAPAMPLPLQADLALAIQAHAAWGECHAGMRRLFQQGPAAAELLRLAADEPLVAGLKTAWRSYWKTRAPQAPHARREAAEHYSRGHLQAAVQWAYGEGQLDAGQLQAAVALLDGPDAPVGPAGAKVYAETLALASAAGQALALPGALVLSGDGESPRPQLLYLPNQTLPLRAYASREQMEADLRERVDAWWPGAAAGPAVFVYERTSKPFRVALNQVMSAFHQQLEVAVQADLAMAPQPPGSRAYPATQALLGALAATEVLAPPAPLAPWQAELAPDALGALGGLQPGTAFEVRWAAVLQQRALIEDHLAGADQGAGQASRLAALERQQGALQQAQAQAEQAIEALLAGDSLTALLALRIDTAAPYRQLYNAHQQAWRAEWAMQRALGQVDETEHGLLQTYAEAPGAVPGDGPGAVASALNLYEIAAAAGHGDARGQELYGPLLLQCQPAAGTPTAVPPGAAVWLYWPGEQGGLQRFDSRASLEAEVLRLTEATPGLRVEYAQVQGDALDYSLQNQLYACEQAALAAQAQAPASHADALARLRAQAAEQWSVGAHAARAMALRQVGEQARGERLAAALPNWLVRQSAAARLQLQDLAQDYARASAAALEVLNEALPARERFAEHAVAAWLAQAFGEGGYAVVLDVPLSVTEETRFSGDPAYGATVEKKVKVPSAARVKLALAQLAMDNLDAALLERLHFMVVEVSGGTPEGRAMGQSAIDVPWLQRCVAALNLAGAYETRLREAFLGADDEPAFVAAYRRERLGEPIRLMLRMQAQRLAQQSPLNAAAAELVQLASDAEEPAAWRRGGRQVVLRGATLEAGGADTGQLGTTLSGIVFIEEQLSGLTVLWLPECPDGKWLRHYPSLAEARTALFQLSGDAGFASYLAGRALEGDPAQHRARLAEAHTRHFAAMIGWGLPRPASTSLTALLLDAQLGRLVQAHRDTSRSNETLYLEQAALGSAMVFVYIKMAIGVLPFVGTAVALHDAWQSANAAVDAFLNQRNGEGLNELRAVLLSLLDAAMDLLPGSTAASPGSARGVLRQRQWRRLAAGTTPLQGRAAARAERAFEGYEYTRDIRLAPGQRGSHGVYRQVYQHAEGHFILRHGRVYAVELGSAPRTWRLSGSASKTYKQPIALDAAGQWQSHGSLYGTLVEGGLAGGGGVLGHLADGADPYWPAAIRGYLPRWWTDRLFRQQIHRLQRAQLGTERLDAQLLKTRELQLRNAARPVLADIKAAFARDIELAIPAFEEQQALLAVVRGRKAGVVKINSSRAATVIVERSVRLANIAKQAAISTLDDIDGVADVLADAVLEPAQFLAGMQIRDQFREQLLLHIDQVEVALKRARQWYDKITVTEHKLKVSDDYAELLKAYHPPLYAAIRSANYAQLVGRYRPGMDLLEWLQFGLRMVEPRKRLDRALFALEHLLEVRPGAAQRKRLLEQCIDAYHAFLQQLRIWEAGDQAFIDPLYFERLDASLRINIADARGWIAKVPEQRPASKPGAPGKRLFETVDEHLLVGVEVPQRGTTAAQFKLTGINGVEEVYVQGAGGKWQLQAPAVPPQPAPSISLKQLKQQATGRLARLPAYRAKVQGYAQQGMLAKDQEHMLASEGRELQRLARLLSAQQADAPLISRLEASAADLHAAGRDLRIAHSAGSLQPTEGDLSYLLAEEQVTLAKVGGIVELNRRPDGRRDFMQEYEIRRSEPDEPLWYAHFHYDRAEPAGLDGYTAAHLKTVAERYVGRQWQASGGAEPWRGALGREMAARFVALA